MKLMPGVTVPAVDAAAAGIVSTTHTEVVSPGARGAADGVRRLTALPSAVAEHVPLVAGRYTCMSSWSATPAVPVVVGYTAHRRGESPALVTERVDTVVPPEPRPATERLPEVSIDTAEAATGAGGADVTAPISRPPNTAQASMITVGMTTSRRGTRTWGRVPTSGAVCSSVAMAPTRFPPWGEAGPPCEG